MKKVVKEMSSIVPSCDVNKIYVLTCGGDIWKAQQTGDKYYFVCLGDSKYATNGPWSSLQSLIESNMGYGTIYEFDSLREFSVWLCENV